MSVIYFAGFSSKSQNQESKKSAFAANSHHSGTGTIVSHNLITTYDIIIIIYIIAQLNAKQ